MRIIRILPFTVLVFLFSGSCDHTILTGEIVMESLELKIGQEYILKLEVPPELDGIYRVMWEVEPSDSASIDFPECTDEECERDSAYKGDRTAIVTVLKPGEIEIIVSGFYRQTNPQPITRKIFQTAR